MYLIATNEYLVNIISFMFFDFFSPFCTFANGQKYTSVPLKRDDY